MVINLKKLNNKGFAISTIIYGLSVVGLLLLAILMGVISTTRANTRTLANTIEEELNRYSLTETSFSVKMSGTNPISQEYIVPEDGWYRIELWGAQGGTNGGLGAYTSGVIELSAGDRLYFYIGKYSNNASKGGQSTDVRLISGDYYSTTDPVPYQSRIMVAAGGGTNVGASGGTLVGYNNNMVSLGGRVNMDGDYDLTDGGGETNGTLVGYKKGYAESTFNTTTVTEAPTPVSSAGGSGYFSSPNANTGGISYIAGYAGCRGMEQGVLINDPALIYYPETELNEDLERYEYNGDPQTIYFVDGMMYAGVNTGNGKARIERLVEKTDTKTSLNRVNNKMDNVVAIEDCIDGENNNLRVVAVAGGRVVPGTQTGTGKCRTITLNKTVSLDEIAIWHKSGVDYTNHTVRVRKSDGSYKFLKKKSDKTDLSETETPTGFRFSAYQYDSSENLPKTGNYFLLPVLSENKILSAHDKSEIDMDPIKVEPFNGNKSQKWSVEYITDPNIKQSSTKDEYKIIELSRYKALTIYQDENVKNNSISASSEFNNTSRNEPQIWEITTLGNGTYAISTVVPVFDDTKKTGTIFPQLDSKKKENYQKILIGQTQIKTQRFRLISVDYSNLAQK